jgi:hypothetical protein
MFFWDIVTCSPVKVNQTSPPEVHNMKHLCSAACFILAYSSTLKMEATCSTETSAITGLHGVISQKIPSGGT